MGRQESGGSSGRKENSIKEDGSYRSWKKEENSEAGGVGMAAKAKAIKKVHAKKYRRFGDLGDQ